MNIAILTPTFCQFSGIDRVVELQANKLVEQGHDVNIYCLKAEMKSKKAKVIEIGMPEALWKQRLLRLFYFLNFNDVIVYSEFMEDYDLVITHQYPMTLIASRAKKLSGVKYIYYNHGVTTPELFSSLPERVYMKLFNNQTNKSIKNADAVVSISKYLQEQLKKETGLDSEVEYDSIDTSRFKLGLNGDLIRAKHNIYKENKVCLFVGRLSPHKGVDLLIEAFNIAQLDNPELRLVIVGKETFDSYFKKLKKLASRIDKSKIIFAGFVPDEQLPEYYAACDVYVTGTQWEGYNMPMAEANACGKPCVAFDIGPHKEVLKQGVLVPNKDTKKFAEEILKLTR